MNKQNQWSTPTSSNNPISPRKDNPLSKLIVDQPAVDELCQILARILRRISESGQPGNK
jgi:hypothetical protein